MPTAPPENGPAGDAFYEVAAMVPAGDPGDPIYQRMLTNPTAALAGRNWLVLYRSDNAHGAAIAVSGMIVLPDDPPPPDGYPLISWAHGTVGVARMCAPSRDWPQSDAHWVNVFPQDLLNNFLAQGWAVAMTDYEGLGVTMGQHPYMLGKSQAYGVLDIVRTARTLFGEQISGQFAIVGHSQGGQAALFAAHHAPGRVDGLIGVAAIAPGNHPLDVIKAGARVGSTDPGYAFTPMFLAGTIGGNPEIRPEEVLSTWAMPHWHLVDELCRAGLSRSAWGTSIYGNTQFKRTTLGVPTYPDFPNEHQEWFNAQLAAMNPDLTIGVPIRISQSADDQRVKAPTIEVGPIRIRGTDALVDELGLTNQGTAIHFVYRRYPPIGSDDDSDRVPEPEPDDDPGDLGIHFATINHDLDALTGWLTERFDGAG